MVHRPNARVRVFSGTRKDLSRQPVLHHSHAEGKTQLHHAIKTHSYQVGPLYSGMHQGCPKPEILPYFRDDLLTKNLSSMLFRQHVESLYITTLPATIIMVKLEHVTVGVCRSNDILGQGEVIIIATSPINNNI
jgi:hypothetical protein